jgi:elongator complex protein 2
VKAVSFLPATSDDISSYLVTGSDDKTLLVFKAPAENSTKFEVVQSSADHGGSINSITSLRTSQGWIIATGASDAAIRIWTFENDVLSLVQTVKTAPKFFPLCMSLSNLCNDTNEIVLAVAGTRDIVQIFTAIASSSSTSFALQATLSGHEGWIRSLDFARESSDPQADILLASASQDKYIRIWRLHQGTELPALAASGADPLSGAYLPGKSPSNKAHRFKAGSNDYSVTFEALLLGHEDWIYSAKWNTRTDGTLQLLSTSADNSLAIWESDASSGIWVSMVRLGEISREKGATTATGSTGGFWTGVWAPDGSAVACLGRTGSWRCWEYVADEDAWKPFIPVTGHTRAVTGVSWSGDGTYLLSTSSDQTTRLHTRWSAPGKDTWHEMSRPQIHGYDLNCIDSLGANQFVSGADEKLMRVFSEPRAVASMLHELGGFGNTDIENMPDAANMPVLGLSNKAIETVDDEQEIQPIDDRDRDAVDPASIVRKSHLEIDHPPFEETLSRHTLWPETEKLYGHGYEISCLAASHDGKIIASACKASSSNHAVIRLFETERWTEIRPPLTAHSLTATRLRFSADDRYLLSVGRDRQWAVFEHDAESAALYTLLRSDPKGHSRMILDCAWAPSTKPAFATAGRDKLVRLWTSTEGSDGKIRFSQSASIPCGVPVTAVDFLPCSLAGKCVLAVGTEAGKIELHLLSEDFSSTTRLENSKM